MQEILGDHKQIRAFFERKIKEWGERVTAVVVLHKGESVSGEELIRFCRERLAAYKSPKSIVFRDDLPRNAMGKVQKAELRKEICS